MCIPSFTYDQLCQVKKQLTLSNTDWNEIGKLTNESSFEYRVNGLLGRMEPRMLRLIQAVNRTFISLEQEGIFISNGSGNSSEVIKNVNQKYKLHLRVAEAVGEKLKAIPKASSQLRHEFHILQLNEIALKYSVDPSLSKEEVLTKPDPASLARLKDQASAWKKKQELAANKALNELEIQQLEEAAKFPQWTSLLIAGSRYEKEFFNWALRDYNPVDVFILFPNTQREIRKAYLSGILGRIRKKGEEVLKCANVQTPTEGIEHRMLGLPVYHGNFYSYQKSNRQWINILNPNVEVIFNNGKNNYTLTVREMFHELSQKNSRESRINFCAYGLINFHPVHGIWDPHQNSYIKLKLSRKGWIHQIPPADVISHEEMLERYGDKIQNHDIFFTVSSTRESLDLTALNCHGFWQIFVKQEHEWRVYDLGVYAYRFQQGLLDGLSMFCNTVKRVLALMDQNGSYTHRQTASFPIFPTPEESIKLFNNIHHIRTTNGVFQFAGHNCSQPVQESAHDAVKGLENFFKVRVSKGKTGVGLLDKILAFLDRCPEIIRRLGVYILQRLLMSHRGLSVENRGKVEWHSVKDYYQNQENMFHPALLHQQIEKAKTCGGFFKTGEISWGNTEYRIRNRRVHNYQTIRL